MTNNQGYTFSPKLNNILNALCEGIETPKIRAPMSGNEKERLIEQVEIQSYPHALLECQHQTEMQIGEDCVQCQQLQYETYKSRYQALVKEKGLEYTHTLKAAFDFYSTLITQYRLTECDELLSAIYPVCTERGDWSVYYLMAIQALAFLRFKQKRYQESIDFFNKQIDLIGPNERIYENLGRVYAQVGEYKKASTCYAQAILLVKEKPEEEQQFSTLLMGLSTAIENPEDALVILESSMDLMKVRFDKPHSLMAKIFSAMGDLHIKLGNIPEAEKCYREATQIFIDTCGYETPLTSAAMNKHAKSLMLLDEKQHAIDVFNDALKVWVKVDNESFEPNMVIEILLVLKEAKISDETVATLELLQNKITNTILKNDLNTLCLLKFVYELFIYNRDIPRAIACCKAFNECLTQLDTNNHAEWSVYREQFLQETSSLLAIMEKI